MSNYEITQMLRCGGRGRLRCRFTFTHQPRLLKPEAAVPLEMVEIGFPARSEPPHKNARVSYMDSCHSSNQSPQTRKLLSQH